MSLAITPVAASTAERRTRYIGIDIPVGKPPSLMIERQTIEYDAQGVVLREHAVSRHTVSGDALLAFLYQTAPDLYDDIRATIDAMDTAGLFNQGQE